MWMAFGCYKLHEFLVFLMTLSQNIYTVKTFEFLIIFNYGQIFLKASSAIYDIFKSLKSFPGNISVFGVF